jgi:hypothetical protein
MELPGYTRITHSHAGFHAAVKILGAAKQQTITEIGIDLA